MGAKTNPWLTYWDTIAEGQLVFQPESDEFVRRFQAAIQPRPTDRMLDYGCGYGFIAGPLAVQVAEVRIWDAAPTMLAAALRNLAQCRNVRPWDEQEGPFDLILVNSVVQYMTPEEFATALKMWARFLAPTGRIVIADLSRPNHSAWRDLVSLAIFSVRRGYVLRAIRGIWQERKRYSAAIHSRPLYRPSSEEWQQFASSAGLIGQQLPRNLTHFSSRYTLILTHASNPHADDIR